MVFISWTPTHLVSPSSPDPLSQLLSTSPSPLFIFMTNNSNERFHLQKAFGPAVLLDLPSSHYFSGQAARVRGQNPQEGAPRTRTEMSDSSRPCSLSVTPYFLHSGQPDKEGRMLTGKQPFSGLILEFEDPTENLVSSSPRFALLLAHPQ